jgi:histidine triad (HIT) family protein
MEPMWTADDAPAADACVFCELLKTGEARWVATESEVVAFLPLDADALAPGHTLVVPRAHHMGVLDTPGGLLGVTMELVQRVGRAMQQALGASGVVLLNASGPHSGQSVGHLHFHVVPRWRGDKATLWPADRSSMRLDGAVHELIAQQLADSRS